jgi:hypothetical protein
MNAGAEQAQEIANETLTDVRELAGLAKLTLHAKRS